MRNSKKQIVESIILSKGDIHFSLYVNPEFGLNNMKKQIVSAIIKTNDELSKITSKVEIKDFLKPIWRLYSDESMLKKLKIPFGIFRNKSDFHILSMPVKHDSDFSLADSFYVKPLLKWMQYDSEYLLVLLNNRSASIMYGDLTEVHVIDEIYFDGNNPDSFFLDEIKFWIMEWKQSIGASSKTQLILLGNETWIESLQKKFSKKKNTRLIKIGYEKEFRGIFIEEVRKVLANETSENMKNKIKEFIYKGQKEQELTDIFEIAEAISNGRVKKLMISEDFKIYGKYDSKLGTLDIHTRDSNHEDDDLLDDLAQEVLKQNGEVIVVSKKADNISTPIKAFISKDENEIRI